ncbi:hypothetical protein GGE50_006361 [Rhizobium leguminosarum]|nr:hypothetical protein [Rhizobium leguminosarum]
MRAFDLGRPDTQAVVTRSILGLAVLDQADRVGRGQISKHCLGKPCVHHGKANVEIANEALPDQTAVTVLVDDVAPNMLPVDHLPKVTARDNATTPSLAALQAGLIELACVDRRNPYSLLPDADRIAVDNPRRS